MELLDHKVVLFFIFDRPSVLFSTVAVPFYIPTHKCTRVPIFSASRPTFVIFFFCFSVHFSSCCDPDGCEVASHWSFDLHFPDDSLTLSIFSWACWPFVSLWRNVLLRPLPAFESGGLVWDC